MKPARSHFPPLPRLRVFAGLVACLASAHLPAPAIAVAPSAVTASPIDEVEEGKAVELPPFVVDEGAKPRRWRIISLPEFELLTDCPDQTAEDFTTTYFRQEQLLRALIPARYLWTSTKPFRHILIEDRDGSGFAKSAAKKLLGNASPNERRKRVEIMPNVRLGDSDSSVVFAYIKPPPTGGRNNFGFLENDNDTRFTFMTGRIQALLLRRSPSLPLWFVEGMSEVYDRCTFSQRDITVGPLSWRSDTESLALERNSDQPRDLAPLATLFDSRAADRDEALRIHWANQSALFVHWAMFADEGQHRDALWQWVDRTTAEGPSEDLFRQCFGIGYSDARDVLSDYLPTAVVEEHEIEPKRLEKTPAHKIRTATPEEIWIARLEWARLALDRVRRSTPEHADAYIQQAQASLALAAQEAPQSAAVKTYSGQLQFGIGNLPAARALLETGTVLARPSPLAYYALARCRYGDIRQSVGDDAKLSPAQTGLILAPLQQALEVGPPTAEIYLLLSDLWLRTELTPTDHDLDVLVEGAAIFSREPSIGLRAVIVLSRAGLIARAYNVAQRGLIHTTSRKDAGRFLKLRNSLAETIEQIAAESSAPSAPSAPTPANSTKSR